MTNKNYSADSETAVLIDSITIDNFELIPNYIHLSEYQSERGLQGPSFYLGINGNWVFDIKKPFYQWRHDVTGQGWLLTPTG